MVMQIQFARFINFPMAISIEVGFMNPLPTKCSRQFCMQVQEGKLQNSVFHLQDIEEAEASSKCLVFLARKNPR